MISDGRRKQREGGREWAQGRGFHFCFFLMGDLGTLRFDGKDPTGWKGKAEDRVWRLVLQGDQALDRQRHLFLCH